MKGFYFSFDALLALGVMSAAMMFVAGVASQSGGEFRQATEVTDSMSTDSRDVMSLASAEKIGSHNQTYFSNLVSETPMEPADSDMTVLEAITYLWASGEFEYADNLTSRYFDEKVDGDYQLRITESGDTFTVPRDVERPEDVSQVVTASGLVSGHTLDQPSEGYRARATVTSAEVERTEIYPVSPSGNLPSSRGLSAGSFDTTRHVPIEEAQGKQIQSAQLDLNLREAVNGPSDYTVTVNGQEVSGTVLDEEGQGSGGGSQYVRYEVSDELEVGQNNSITFSTDSIFFTGGFLQPGSRLRVDYIRRPELVTEEQVNRRKHLKYVRTDYGSLTDDEQSGVYDVENFNIPENAEINDVELQIQAQGVGTGDSPYGWDVRAVVNGEQVIQEEGNGDYTAEIDITDQVNTGNNIAEIYVNHDGEQFWGGTTTVLNSDPGGVRQSFIEMNYTEERETGYDSYEAIVAEEVGTTSDQQLEYQTQFPDYDQFSRINLYPVMWYPNSTTFEARTEGEPYQEVYSTDSLVPSLVTIDRELFDFDRTNYVRMTDTSSDTSFLEYTLFEYSVFVDPRVGYGQVFETEQKARQDAVQRLEKKAGEYFDFEDIEPSSVTIGGERQLWGPATVTLVRWND